MLQILSCEVCNPILLTLIVLPHCAILALKDERNLQILVIVIRIMMIKMKTKEK